MHSRHSVETNSAAGSESLDRRDFLAATAALGCGIAAAHGVVGPPTALGQSDTLPTTAAATGASGGSRSLIGNYGEWASGLVADPPELSFRQDKWSDLAAWRQAARDKAWELLSPPAVAAATAVEVVERTQFDGLDVQHLRWRLPYGRPTHAVMLKPAGTSQRLPAILGLHDHGGNKYFGHRKITRIAADQHPLMRDHQEHYYAGRAWANEIAKRGFVVLVHDTFTFASRRVKFEDMSEIRYGDCQTTDKSDVDPENSDNIKIYNAWAAAHEHIMAKSLFCAGTTWPGVYLAEDQAALSVLAADEHVDPERLGCAGLSGGGLRTVFLGGLDPRIKCAICVGFMSTWRDFLKNKSYTHTWMTYAPLLPRYLDFPEILGLRAPLPTMVQNCVDDALYTVPEMERADQILASVFSRAGQPDHYRGELYPGKHKFDADMQRDAFAWFERWLS